jgi:hypothetical protein
VHRQQRHNHNEGGDSRTEDVCSTFSYFIYCYGDVL